MKNPLKKWFVRNSLRIKVAIVSAAAVYVAAGPLSLYFLTLNINDAAARQWDDIRLDSALVENEARRHNAIVHIDQDFLKRIADPGEKIVVRENDLKVEYEREDRPRHESKIEQFVGAALVNTFVSLPKIQDRLKEIQKEEDVQIFTDSSGQLHAKYMKKFNISSENTATLVITKNINGPLTRPIVSYIHTLPGWLAWFMIPSAAAALIGIMVIFQPLEKALTQGFKKIEASNYTKKFVITGKYGREITHVKERVNVILGQMEHIVQQNMQNLQDISHEVNTHLTAIKQNVDITLAYGMDDKKFLKERLEFIDNSVKRTTEITSVILDLANLRTASKVMATPHKIMDLINNYIQYFNKLYRDITVIKEFEETDADIFIIREHFFLALKPIMENAVKYSHPKCKRIVIDILHRPEYIGVSVTNWGVPINMEEVPKLFTRHYRGRHGQEYSSGSGLGLSLSSEVLTLYQGKIEVDSIETPINEEVVNKNTFTLWFPKNT